MSVDSEAATCNGAQICVAGSDNMCCDAKCDADAITGTQGATTYTGGGLASFVYTTVYDVIQVGGKGLPDDRIVIGLGTAVTAAVRASDLYPA